MNTPALINREYEGKLFTFREDGYFNMTKAAQSFGKRIDNFFRMEETTEYLEALSPSLPRDKDLIEVKRGSGLLPSVGTWGHPKLAVFFARWLSPKFAVFCDMVIDDILNKKAELTITKPEESMSMKVPQSFAEALRIAADLAEQAEAQKQRLAISEPKAAIIDKTFSKAEGERLISITKFARRLERVNTQAVKKDLMTMKFFYHRGGSYKVYSQWREMFKEKGSVETGRSEIFLTVKGQSLVTELYQNGKLTLLKKYQNA